MKSIVLFFSVLSITLFTSSFSRADHLFITKNDTNHLLHGKWKVTWTNSEATNLQTAIVWQLNQDGSGLETVTIFGKENNSDITFQFPLTWKVSKAEGEHTFLNMHYGTGKILTENNQSSAFDTEHNIANAIIQKKDNAVLSIEYFYYSDNMLYINNYLDGKVTKNKLARTKLEKID